MRWSLIYIRPADMWAAYTPIMSAWDGVDLCFYLHRSGPKWRSLVPLAIPFSLSFQVCQLLEGKQAWGRQQSTSGLGLHTFHTVHGAALEDSDPISGLWSSRTQELSNPSCLSGIPQPGSLFSWTTESGPDPFCWRPFPSRTHSEQKLCTSYHPALFYSRITGLRENLAKWTG